MKKINKQPGKNCNGLLITVLAAVVILLFLNISIASAQQWGGKMNVGYNPTGEEVQTEKLIQFAAWSWAERLGLPIQYSGITSSKTKSGYTIYKWEEDSFFGQGVLASTKFYYDQFGIISIADISLRKSTALLGGHCLQQTIAHELGHAIKGPFHSENIFSLMFPIQIHCVTAITPWDVFEMPGTDKSPCYAELNLFNDILIPDINGKIANLEYTGSGDNHTWELGWYIDNPLSIGCDINRVDENLDLYLDDVRTMGTNWVAKLNWTGNDTWELAWAI